MRGFGAVPKRGAEVGGILIGRVETAPHLTVYIEDYEEVQIEYKFGPSYQLSPKDEGALREACMHWQPAPDNPQRLIGFFRSHTREGLSLTDDDLLMFGIHFADPTNIALLIKPSGTGMSKAGFHFYEDGRPQATTYLEFPFRRQALDGSDTGNIRGSRPLIDRGGPRRRRQDPASPLPAGSSSDLDARRERLADPPPPLALLSEPDPLLEYTSPARTHGGPIYAEQKSGSWIWIPLLFVFLLIGLLLGFQAAGAMAGREPDPLSLDLRVEQAKDSLSVIWNRRSPAARRTQKGVLEITEGTSTRRVNLDAQQIQAGRVIYHNGSKHVGFRLELHPTETLTISESLDWRGDEPSGHKP